VANAPHFSDAIAAYDADRHLVVIVGAAPQGVGTWTWDGDQWNLLTGAWPQRVDPATAAMCFDRSNHSVVLFGGWGSGVTINNDTPGSGMEPDGPNSIQLTPHRHVLEQP
jgi:hypothetical protein